MLQMRTSLFLSIVIMVQTAYGYPTQPKCTRQNAEIVNGIETSPDPSTIMTSSSERDSQHRAEHGLVFGTTGWSPYRNRKGEWLQADFGSWAYVSQIRVYLLSPGVEVNVKVALDTSDWQTADTFKQDGRIIVSTFSPPVLAQYARVTVTDWSDDVQLEMLVVGCDRQRGRAEERLVYGG